MSTPEHPELPSSPADDETGGMLPSSAEDGAKPASREVDADDMFAGGE